VEGRIGGVVDIPNACVSVALPTDIFEFDIHPHAGGPQKQVDASKVDLARAR
jgi:formamidase